MPPFKTQKYIKRYMKHLTLYQTLQANDVCNNFSSISEGKMVPLSSRSPPKHQTCNTGADPEVTLELVEGKGSVYGRGARSKEIKGTSSHQ